jgi:YYY domain-containing protein
MPLTLLLMGMLASSLLARQKGSAGERFLSLAGTAWRRFFSSADDGLLARLLLYLLLAFVFGSIACINPWDMPICALLLGAALLMDTFYAWRDETRALRWRRVVETACLYGLLCALSYLAYWPFYASYQQLYVSGTGLVSQSTAMPDYLRVFGIWLFFCASFLLFELYRWWQYIAAARQASWLAACWRWPSWQRVSLYLFLCTGILLVLTFLGTRFLLGALLALGFLLFYLHGIRSAQARDEHHWDIRLRFAYLLVLLGLIVALGIEVVYIRDFLDGSAYARMNTVFKFSMQIWLCLGVGCALAIQHLWRNLRGMARPIWSACALLFLLGGSVFLVAGTYARIQDHQQWIDMYPPSQNAHYTPTLDGFAFVRAWYPGDAQAITWLNVHVDGSPVLLEAAIPYDYTWAGRVSVYTGLPCVLGWLGHENEQRYQNQAANRLADVSLIYTTRDSALALELLHHYDVRYIYVGDLEREAYAPQSSAGLDKFDTMTQQGFLRLVYRWDGVTIYRMV